MAESTTQSVITEKKLREIDGYPSAPNIELDGIIYFKEDSFKDVNGYEWINDRFATASKNQKRKDRGTPDYTVAKLGSNTIVIIECKQDVAKHSTKANVKDYLTDGYGTATETERYAINGVLWYAQFLKNEHDVVAIAVSGTTESNSRVTTFVWPQNKDIKDIILVEDGTILNSLVSIEQYNADIPALTGRGVATEEEVKKQLRTYTLACANFLRANGIEDNSKAGFVSAIILGLTNKKSRLYSVVKTTYDNKELKNAKVISEDALGKESVKLLKEALYGNGRDEYDEDFVEGIFDIDNIPKGKRRSLRKFYDILLSKDELTKTPKNPSKYFKEGDTVLSSCVYSLYNNVILVLEEYQGIDVMGEFYTTFLRFTKGNAKEKGIVLTPKHITDLFCDIAEYYNGPFSENTKVLDICTGTGGFLISALYRIKSNIYNQKIAPDKKRSKYEYAQKNSLIGVEKDASMYALAYANMRFHGDGKSNLFNCSSLMSDSFLSSDGSGDAFVGDRKIKLNDALKEFGNIDIGMINPPYSLGNNDAKTKEYQIIKDINELKEKIKKQKKIVKSSGSQVDIDLLNQLNDELTIKNQELQNENLNEVVIQKGQTELDFIASMLHYLKEGGIGIAIVPMSCAGNADKKLREEILKHHTLLACMTMPGQLFFDSNVMTATCIMVFKAHIPHDENKSVFFGRWKNDGFIVVPHNGRKATDAWHTIRNEWMDQLDGTANVDNRIWMRKKIKISDEALAEAYVETDYSKLTDADFERTLKKYALFQYMNQHGLLEV